MYFYVRKMEITEASVKFKKQKKKNQDKPKKGRRQEIAK